uniref:Uncharacterized protein n=1 Tax=Amorphochlora amoebiformis TaxID=1561963 RepID=A0A6T6UDR8_9EUKA
MARNQEKAQALLNKYNSFREKMKNSKVQKDSILETKKKFLYQSQKIKNKYLKNLTKELLDLYGKNQITNRAQKLQNIQEYILRKNKIEKFSRSFGESYFQPKNYFNLWNDNRKKLFYRYSTLLTNSSFLFNKKIFSLNLLKKFKNRVDYSIIYGDIKLIK